MKEAGNGINRWVPRMLRLYIFFRNFFIHSKVLEERLSEVFWHDEILVKIILTHKLGKILVSLRIS